jgi:hypothetical protein
MATYKCRNCNMEYSTEWSTPDSKTGGSCSSSNGHMWDRSSGSRTDRYQCNNCSRVIDTTGYSSPSVFDKPSCTSSLGTHDWRKL